MGESQKERNAGPAPPSETRMGPIDKLFWWAEQDILPMTIGNIWELKDKMSPEAVMEQIEPLFSKDEYRRYRQIGVERWGYAYWTDDPNFKFEDHVVEHELKAPGTRNELEELVSELFSTCLDRTKPLWRMDLINGYNGGGTILVFRLHHAITDGQGSIRSTLSVLHSADGIDLGNLQYMAAKPAEANLTEPVSILKKAVGALQKIVAFIVAALVLLYQALLCMVLGLRILLRPKVALYRPPQNIEPKKKLSWSTGVDLDRVKFVKNAYEVTVNDVLVSCVTGAIRSYLVENNLQNQEPVCGIPVSMRSPNDWEMKNASSMFFTHLPTLEADREACLKEVNRRLIFLKGSPAALYIYYNMMALYSIPFINKILYSFNRVPMNWFCSRMACVMTNVPGPQVPLVFGRARVISYIPFVMAHCAGAINVGVMSYCNKVYLGVQTEDNYIPGGPRVIVDRFEKELEHLHDMATKKSASKKMKEE